MFLPMMKKEELWRNPATKEPKSAPLLPAVAAAAAHAEEQARYGKTTAVRHPLQNLTLTWT